MPIATHITVALDITAEEAARQLEAGKPITVYGGGNLTIIALTGRQDVTQWEYQVYPSGCVGREDVLYSSTSPQAAVERALQIAGGE